ncbi:MAG: hypothetical protein WCB59_20655, partial [Candidatus Sulfotelmatobacter sp.]
MDLRSSHWWMSLSALSTLFLASCAGVGTSSGTQPQPTSYQLTVTAPPAGAGTITSSPAGISCPSTCSASFAQGTQVKLTATPGTNYFFAGWGGSCSGTNTCSVTLTAAATVSATFNPGIGLTVTTAGTGSGTITSSPAGINCPTTCSASFPQNTQITLTETPATNDTFGGWSGCTGTTTCTVTLTGTSSVTATFSVPVQGINNINHIILFAQENRSLDHYFGQMAAYWAANGYGTNGQTFDGLPQTGTPLSVPGCAAGTWGDSCSPSPSNPISSFHLQSACIENQSPFW